MSSIARQKTRTGPSQRSRFRDWLLANRNEVDQLQLTELLRRYRGVISKSSAYRVAVAMRVRGTRQHSTRYAKFWNTINWRLPDSSLSAIWKVTRGNIRQRRVRLGVGDAAYNARWDRENESYLSEVAHERRRAARFEGLRPS